jgi:hypothetical protein
MHGHIFGRVRHVDFHVENVVAKQETGQSSEGPECELGSEYERTLNLKTQEPTFLKLSPINSYSNFRQISWPLKISAVPSQILTFGPVRVPGTEQTPAAPELYRSDTSRRLATDPLNKHFVFTNFK